IPYPGAYLLDPSGRVIAKFFENDYKQRAPALEMLEETGAVLRIPRATVHAEQLRLFSSASDEIVQPYKKVALFLDVSLAPKMHVYAPGVKGYIPIDWKMAATPAAQFYPVSYPASQMLRLAVIKETVPVYRGRFRLAEDVVFGSEAGVKPLVNAHHDLTLTGSLRYQACDDHQCYLPQTVPLKWTFHYQGLDRQRAPLGIQHKGKL
ncbi:MAG: protein-disulfide reductase DsbD domain-containing protein, partial [Terriglobia bacterium]